MAYPVAEARILEAEAQLGRVLPARLCARLLRNNGGSAQSEEDDWELFPVCDPTDHRTMRKTANHLVAETKVARSRWPGFPADAVTVASNGSGDLLVLRPGSDKIEVWHHETGEVVPISSLEL
jgi:hypothetical protein